MIHKQNYLYISLIMLLFCLACNKITVERNTNPQGYADSQMVGTWKVISLKSDKPFDWDGNGTKETDIYSTLSPCDKDNLYQFGPSKTGVYKLTCSTTKSGTWQLSNTYFTVSPGDTPTQSHRITSMTSISFESQQTVQLGIDILIVYTSWSRQ
jgi:hypothetical protein